MPQYVALLRGIGPTNPNMRNTKLAAVLESIGCSAVRPVLASGNLVFNSKAKSPALLESKLEAALREKLGLSIDVIVRRQDEIEAMVKLDPFAGREHGKDWYLTVTFHKDGQPPVYSTFARKTLDGPKMMAGLEKKYGKRITTRTWNTIGKIVATFESPTAG